MVLTTIPNFGEKPYAVLDGQRQYGAEQKYV